MIHTKDGVEVLDNLQSVISPGSGIEHWGASYFGPRYSRAEASRTPHALMTQMAANETILPHFHGVIQFQLFPSGSGMMGKFEVAPLMLQYKDRHTAYGPLVAGPHGCTFIAMRNRVGDSAPVYRSNPDYRERMKPSKRRNWLSSRIHLSTRPVLQHRKDVVWEHVYDPEKITDEISAQLVRLGAGMTAPGPDPKKGNGYYVYVASGDMRAQGELLPALSMVYVDPTEDGFEISAGPHGLEALVMVFPFDDD